MAPRKKGRGKATGAMFEKLRKKGLIAVQACMKAQLAYRFRSIKYHLHKLYKSYTTKEEAMAHPPEEVALPIWEKCCDLWETRPIRKKMLVNHTSGSKSLLCSRMEKERMKTLYADRDPTQISREIAEEVFARHLLVF
ncbi:hypothetical protein CJ030_MR4G021063 [Morella rubra]|uniref:Uncharacterized protein n=1 Tax=Morella rubra TaxID=262757 RepID=A0A6A1W0D0_9ROSI|nr:hypothetical protein CJ030_MR4G021063 [Morella rubra]